MQRYREEGVELTHAALVELLKLPDLPQACPDELAADIRDEISAYSGASSLSLAERIYERVAADPYVPLHHPV